MKRRYLLVLVVVTAFAGTGLLSGQRVAKLNESRPSPDGVVEGTVGGKAVKVEYGRPLKKGREIFGGLVPFGQVWRTGANEKTVLTVESDFMVGKIHVPKGSYALFTIPGKDEWTLILSKNPKGWGTQYNPAEDLGRTPMKVTKLAKPVEQLTILIEPAGGNRGSLKIQWDTIEASVDLVAH